MEAQSHPTLDLAELLGESWTHIEAARALSRETLSELRAALADSDSDDACIIVSGSLGREEFTRGSDIDWTLLVDGIADPNHHSLFLDAKHKIGELAKKGVGREGTFAAIVSSHDLIHNIGGEDDTNKNLTRRLLLLLESQPIGRSLPHERVTKNILKRYLFEDLSFWRGTTIHRHYIPHFLLNDFARLWRTMAVDFAYKLRTRPGEGWAMRNIKLRMSRKLLYAAGLLGCFRCHLDFDAKDRDDVYLDPGNRTPILEYVDEIFWDSPLDIVSKYLRKNRHLDATSRKLFGAYNNFLGILGDEVQREHLEKLGETSAHSDDIYKNARDASHAFRDALLELFFDEKTGLAELTRLYAVF